MNAYLSFAKLLLFYLEEVLVQGQFILHMGTPVSLLPLITDLFELSFCSHPFFPFVFVPHPLSSIALVIAQSSSIN